MDKIGQWISLGMKAGVVIHGRENCLNGNAKIKLMIFSEDIKEASKKEVLKKYNGKSICWGTSDILGERIGKGPRSVVGIKDNGIAEKIWELAKKE